jgi:hypothetical protein
MTETNLLRGYNPFLRSYSKFYQHFMEPKDSLPCSQEPATGPYPEPGQSSPYLFILSF